MANDFMLLSHPTEREEQKAKAMNTLVWLRAHRRGTEKMSGKIKNSAGGAGTFLK